MSLRLVLALSLDGRLAPPQGGAAQLGGSADRRLLEEALAWADCCLIGAGSLRAHRSSCVIHQPDLLQQRLSQAKPSQPLLIVVSRSCTPPGFDPDWPFWQQPFSRWLLAPFETNPAPLPDGFERLLRLGPWAGLKQQLAAEGLKQVLLLGGAQLAAALLQADQVDELQLTICPLLLGGDKHWLPAGFELQPQRWQLLEQRPIAGGELLVRYQIQRSGNC